MPLKKDAKPIWRNWAKSARGTLTPEENAQLCAALATWLRAHNVKTVLGYHALAGEPDISALAKDFSLLTTRAIWKPIPKLTLHDWHSATERGPGGVLQPPKGTPERTLDEVEAVILPGLAFDKQGVRLGYGGGFYDRLLEGKNILLVGVCTERVRVDALPSEPHDVRASAIITEAGVFVVAESNV